MIFSILCWTIVNLINKYFLHYGKDFYSDFHWICSLLFAMAGLIEFVVELMILSKYFGIN